MTAAAGRTADAVATTAAEVATDAAVTTADAVTTAAVADLELDRTGSISVTLHSAEDDAAVTEGSLVLYAVANLTLEDGNMVYVLTEDFADSGISLEDVTDAALAESLAAYVQGNDLVATEVAVDETGTATFDDLSLGLYLIIQSEASAESYTMDAFLVTLPLAEDGAWIYAVDASPKVELVTITTTGTPDEDIPEEDTPATDTPDTPEEDTPKSTTTSRLPQTGQLFWPIPLLVVAGAACLVWGAYRHRRYAAEQHMVR